MERLHMNYLRDIIHRLRAGDSQRRIARDLKISRTTVSKYRDWATAQGYLQPDRAMPDDLTLAVEPTKAEIPTASVTPTLTATATSVPTNTPEPIPSGPAGGDTYSGPLNGGTITFTIAPDGASIQGWSVNIPGTVTCTEGGSASGVRGDFNFTIPIQNQAFEYASESVTFRGLFGPATAASGSFQMRLGAGRAACTFGPLKWTAAPSSLPVATATHAATPQPTVTQTRAPTLQPIATPTPKVQTSATPVIKSVSLRYDTSSGSLVIFQDIAFYDPDGDADWGDYELVHTTAASVEVRGGTIEVASRQQKLGATITGQWSCRGSKYDVTLRVTILDRAGNKSNAVEYTMNCH